MYYTCINSDYIGALEWPKAPTMKTGWTAKECNSTSEVLEMLKQLNVSLNMWYMKHLEVVRNEWRHHFIYNQMI